MGKLSGKAVIITGAGRGLGRAFALRAGLQGAAVIVNDIDAANAAVVADEIVAAGGRARPMAGSIADWAFAESLTSSCLETFGSVDGLVNNAALHYLELPWDEQEQRVRSLIEVNVLGTLFCGIHALKIMKAQRSGSIVNVTSGAHIGMGLRSTYGASKGAVASVTYGWALEAMPYNIRVNALSPIANTPMTDESFAEEARMFPDRPLPGPSTLSAPPETIAPLVMYLLSDRSDGITGQIVRMAGNSINLVAHPSSAPPVEASDEWNEDVVEAVFDRSLRGALKPVGVTAQSYNWKPQKA